MKKIFNFIILLVGTIFFYYTISVAAFLILLAYFGTCYVEILQPWNIANLPVVGWSLLVGVILYYVAAYEKEKP